MTDTTTQPAWIARLVIEREDLHHKLKALKVYAAAWYPGAARDQALLLMDQETAMSKYLHILDVRLLRVGLLRIPADADPYLDRVKPVVYTSVTLRTELHGAGSYIIVETTDEAGKVYEAIREFAALTDTSISHNKALQPADNGKL